MSRKEIEVCQIGQTSQQFDMPIVPLCGKYLLVLLMFMPYVGD